MYYFELGFKFSLKKKPLKASLKNRVVYSNYLVKLVSSDMGL